MKLRWIPALILVLLYQCFLGCWVCKTRPTGLHGFFSSGAIGKVPVKVRRRLRCDLPIECPVGGYVNTAIRQQQVSFAVVNIGTPAESVGAEKPVGAGGENWDSARLNQQEVTVAHNGPPPTIACSEVAALVPSVSRPLVLP